MPRLIGFDRDTLRPIGPADIARREQIAKRMRRWAAINRMMAECRQMANEAVVAVAIGIPATGVVLWWIVEHL